MKMSGTFDDIIHGMSMHIARSVLRSYQRIDNLLTHLDPTASPGASVTPGSARPRNAIVVFPGSFNPPTSAHLAMLRQARAFARKQGGRWWVYAALSQYSVNKETVERMTLLDRVVLLEKTLKQRRVRAGVMLLNRGLYVEQARGILSAFPETRRLFFLTGFDKIVQILDPRYYTDRDAALRELFALAHLLVAPRGGDGEGELVALLAQAENQPFAHAIHPLPLDERYREISSSRIRLDDAFPDVPQPVRDFLRRTRPYAPFLDSCSNVYTRRTQALQALLR